MTISFSLKVYFVILLFSNLVHSRINVKFTNLHCESLDKNVIEFCQCSLTAVRRDLAEISIHGKLILKPINTTEVTVSFRRRGDDKRRPLYQYRIEACEFMRNKRRNHLAEIFFKFFEFPKYSNINHTCPYNHDIILKNSRIDTRPLNFLAVAHGEYNLFTHWAIQGRQAADINLSLKIF